MRELTAVWPHVPGGAAAGAEGNTSHISHTSTVVPASSSWSGLLTYGMKPGIHCVTTQWIRGFMAFHGSGAARTVMLMVPA